MILTRLRGYYHVFSRHRQQWRSLCTLPAPESLDSFRRDHVFGSMHYPRRWNYVACEVQPCSNLNISNSLSKFSDVNMQLFPGLPEGRLSTFSCGHVIPANNLQCLVIGKGPSGREFQFTYKDRGNEALVRRLSILSSVAEHILIGLV